MGPHCVVPWPAANAAFGTPKHRDLRLPGFLRKRPLRASRGFARLEFSQLFKQLAAAAAGSLAVGFRKQRFASRRFQAIGPKASSSKKSPCEFRTRPARRSAPVQAPIGVVKGLIIKTGSRLLAARSVLCGGRFRRTPYVELHQVRRKLWPPIATTRWIGLAYLLLACMVCLVSFGL